MKLVSGDLNGRYSVTSTKLVRLCANKEGDANPLPVELNGL